MSEPIIRLWRGFHSEQLSDFVRQAWNRDELLIVCPPGLKNLNFVDFLPQGKIETVGDWSDFSVLPLQNKINPTRPNYPEKPILGVFTSGTSSGSPRLVLYSRSNLHFALNGIRSFFDINLFDTIFCYPQPFHAFGLVLGYLHAVVFNLRLVTGEAKYAQSAHEKRITLRSDKVLTLGTPTHFYDLISRVRTENLEIFPSYSCILGGAKVSVPLWHSIQNELKINLPSIGYGASEASLGVTHQSPGQAPTEEGEIGNPIAGVTTRIIANEGLELSGPNVCLAMLYEGRLEFPKNILLRDDVRLREDGILICTGRNDLMLNRGGAKFSLELIEETIKAQLKIEAICVALPDERLGEELGVLIRGNPCKTSLQDLRTEIYSHLKKEFGLSFDSTRLLQVDQMPLNENSKVDRKRGAQLFSNLTEHS